MSTKKPIIAAFDFDETLIIPDSLPDFLRHSFPLPIFILKTVTVVPMLVKFKFRRISNHLAKEQLLTAFLGGMPAKRFAVLCDQYSERIENIVNLEAIKRLRWHQKRGDTVVIISASPEDWIYPWARKHAIDKIIATQLEKKDGKVTGKLSTPNCHGHEKTIRFLSEYPEREAYELYTYGDGKSDQEMFSLSDKSFLRKFE